MNLLRQPFLVTKKWQFVPNCHCTDISHPQWLFECPRHPLSQHALGSFLSSWRHLCLSFFHQWAVTLPVPPFSFSRFSRRLCRHLGCSTFHRIPEKDVSYCVRCKLHRIRSDYTLWCKLFNETVNLQQEVVFLFLRLRFRLPANVKDISSKKCKNKKSHKCQHLIPVSIT